MGWAGGANDVKWRVRTALYDLGDALGEEERCKLQEDQILVLLCFRGKSEPIYTFLWTLEVVVAKRGKPGVSGRRPA